MRTALAITAAVVSVVAVLVINQDQIVRHFVKSWEHDLLLPKMSVLAAEGKSEAVTWMLLNDSTFRADSSYTALRKSAAEGHPQSMYLYASVLKYQKDEKGAKEWISRAAAEGYPAAVLELAK